MFTAIFVWSLVIGQKRATEVAVGVQVDDLPRHGKIDGLVHGVRTEEIGDFAQIAARLHLSERTVENHVFNALGALGLHNRVQLATWVTDQRVTAGA